MLSTNRSLFIVPWNTYTAWNQVRSTVVSLSVWSRSCRCFLERDDSYWWKRAERAGQQVEGNGGRAPYSNTALQRARPIRVRGRRRSVSSEQSERKEILYREKWYPSVSRAGRTAAVPFLSSRTVHTHTFSNRTDALLLYRSCNCHYFPRGEFESLKVSYFQREREEEIATNGGWRR